MIWYVDQGYCTEVESEDVFKYPAPTEMLPTTQVPVISIRDLIGQDIAGITFK